MKTSFKTPLKSMYAVAIILFATISGCKKDDATPTNGIIDAEVQATADDKALAEETENGNTTMNDYAKDIDPSSAGGRTEGTVLGIGQTSYNILTKTLTIDFGTTNAVCTDGRKRKGKVFIVFTEGKPRLLDHTTTTTQENYYVNDIKVEGSRVDVVKTTIASNVATQKRTITLSGRKLTFTDGKTFIENGTYNYTATLALLTNAFDVTILGTSTGTNRAAKSYIMNITSPLKAVSTCAGLPPVSGKMELGINNLTDKLTIDYGTGTCDRVATISYKGQTATINF